MNLHLTSNFEVIILSDKRAMALFHHFFLQFVHIIEICQKAYYTTTSRPPAPRNSQILKTFKLYSVKARMGQYLNTKQKVKQAMVKI